VRRAEINTYAMQKVETLQDTIRYTSALVESYMTLSDQASAAQDVAALSVIATAGVAAGGLLYNAHLDLIKGAGLAAGTLTATTSYFKPGETSAALLDAAEQLICVRRAAEPFQSTFNHSAEAIEIVSTAIQNVRLNLRKKLSRSLPDYKSLVASLRQTLAEQPATEDAYLDRVEDLSTLRTTVAVCLLAGG
jgi:hypothetical protein